MLPSNQHKHAVKPLFYSIAFLTDNSSLTEACELHNFPAKTVEASTIIIGAPRIYECKVDNEITLGSTDPADQLKN